MKKMERYKDILSRFAAWAEREPRILMGIIVGSRARKACPADEFSDLDLLLVVSEPEAFWNGTWTGEMGDVQAQFTEPTFCGAREIRVLYENAQDVDYPVLSEKMLHTLLRDFPSLFARGARVIFDRMNGTPLVTAAAEAPKAAKKAPTAAQFDNLVQDFWFHTVWVTKKMLRGETWAAKQCLDGYLKSRLLELLEIYAYALHGESYDTWHDGRFLDRWTEPWVTEALRCAYAPYDLSKMPEALWNTAEIFRRAAKETAETYGFPYPEKADIYATNWTKQALKAE